MSEQDDGFVKGRRIAKISFITLASIGVAEIIISWVSGSVVIFADGIDSFGDAAISFIVWLGLYTALRKPDSRFRFGYYKVESLAALLAAVGMIIMGLFILYNAIESLMQPKDITHVEITMATLAAAAAISGHRAFQMRRIAKRYKLLSLETDAKNSIKDSSASILGFFSLLIATHLGFEQMDSIGAMAIAGFIFSVSYVAIKESSLVLLDAVKNPKLTDQLKSFIEEKHKVRVLNVLLRPMGPYLHGEIEVLVEGSMTIEEFDDMANAVEKSVKSRFPSLKKVVVTAEPK